PDAISPGPGVRKSEITPEGRLCSHPLPTAVQNAGASGKVPPPSGPLPSLVVCPKSVMDNWRVEAERFYPGLRVHLWRGEPAEEFSAARENSALIVINYAQLRALSAGITNAPWLVAILDEAH